MTNRNPGDDDNTPATTAGPNTGIGRRNAYHDIVKSQWHIFERCNITLFSLFSSYTIAKHKEVAIKKAGSTQITPLQILLQIEESSGKITVNFSLIKIPIYI